MRRAIVILALALTAFALDSPRSRAATDQVMNGIGLLDYRNKPDFKIGDWVHYRMKSHSELGASDDYDLTVLIAGEEDFWGDPGFWVETWVEFPGVAPQTRASLMSYDIYNDSLATRRLMLYMRRVITMTDDEGNPKIDINKPSAGTLKARREVQNPVRYSLDTLGVDTVQTPKGVFKGLKVLMKQGTGATQSVGDSSLYTEVRENRTSWYSLEVPITHLVREDIESINAHKSWMIGRSGEATPLAIRDRGLGSARLIDFGHGRSARLVPEHLRHTIAEQAAAEKAATKAAAKSTAPRSAPAKKPASSGTTKSASASPTKTR